MKRPAESLLSALESGGASAAFCVAGTLPLVLPELVVEGVGPVALPLTRATAKKLVRAAERAPYGRGEETLVDTNVRRVWQIDAARFALENPDWRATLDAAIAAVQQGLALRGTVQARLYKLLIYDEGSFFTPHRDTEQTDGMFATLVIGLPSAHEGGALIVTHDGETRTIEFGGARSARDIQYTAFYTDCVHEIRPVTSGHRLALVYNLVLAGRRVPKPPRTSAAVTRAAEALQELFDGDRLRVAIPLAHDYTQKGLAPGLLKGADRGRFAVLAAAARRLGYRVRLGLLSVHQTGDVDWDAWSDDDLDAAEMGEVVEESFQVEHLVDEDGGPARPRGMDLEVEDLLLDGELDDLPWEKEVTEASGNAGVSVDRWYRSGVVITWPPAREHELLCRQGQTAALPAFARLVASARSDEDRAACRRFASRLISCWEPYERTGAPRMLVLLATLGEPELAERFLAIVARHPQGDEGPSLVKLARKLGHDLVASGVAGAFAHLKGYDRDARFAAVAALVEALCLEARDAPAARELAALLSERICTWDDGRPAPHRHADEESPDQRPDGRDRVVASLVRALDAAGERDLLDATLAFVLADVTRWPLASTLAPAALSLGDLPAAAALRAHCIAALSARAARAPAPPTDWRIERGLGCVCRDCLAVNTFLRDPGLSVLRLPLAKERRKHLHRGIDAAGLPLRHLTERHTSPNTLVLTKTRADHERRLRAHARDEALLAKLTGSPPRAARATHARAAPAVRPARRL